MSKRAPRVVVLWVFRRRTVAADAQGREAGLLSRVIGAPKTIVAVLALGPSRCLVGCLVGYVDSGRLGGFGSAQESWRARLLREGGCERRSGGGRQGTIQAADQCCAIYCTEENLHEADGRVHNYGHRGEAQGSRGTGAAESTMADQEEA